MRFTRNKDRKKTDKHAEGVRRRSQLNRAEGSRGGLRPVSFPLAGSRGGAPLWGLGQRPNCWSGDHFKGIRQQRRRQRSVPASNFALPQERPQADLPTTCTLSRQMGATDQQGKRFGFLLLVFFVAGVSPLRRRVGGFAVAHDTPSAAHFSIS